MDNEGKNLKVGLENRVKSIQRRMLLADSMFKDAFEIIRHRFKKKNPHSSDKEVLEMTRKYFASNSLDSETQFESKSKKEAQ